VCKLSKVVPFLERYLGGISKLALLLRSGYAANKTFSLTIRIFPFILCMPRVKYIVASLNVRKKSQLMQPISIIDRSRKEFHG